MPIKNEAKLYQEFVRATGRLEAIFRDHPALSGWINGELISVERTLGGQQLHLLGEVHFSRKPVEYIHQNLVSRIERDPQRWLILDEDAETVIEAPIHSPTQFYIQGLAKLFKLPYEEALADLYAPDTREYIKRKTGISEEDIDRSILTEVMELETEEDQKDSQSIVKRMSENLQKPEGYTRRLLSMGPKTDLNFGEVIGKNWNDYSRERFHKLLKRYFDRTEILIRVGCSHLPAFE